MVVALKHSLETGWITTENIFFCAAEKGKGVAMLADVFRTDLSLHLEEKNSLSSRVCSPCGTKVWNCAAMLSQIREKLTSQIQL